MVTPTSLTSYRQIQGFPALNSGIAWDLVFRGKVYWKKWNENPHRHLKGFWNGTVLVPWFYCQRNVHGHLSSAQSGVLIT